MQSFIQMRSKYARAACVYVSFSTGSMYQHETEEKKILFRFACTKYACSQLIFTNTSGNGAIFMPNFEYIFFHDSP
jgi:hypothetical protein